MRDPLGEGFACTWRTRLIKVAAEVITRSRRVIVRLSSSWPYLDHFLHVGRAVNQPRILLVICGFTVRTRSSYNARITTRVKGEAADTPPPQTAPLLASRDRLNRAGVNNPGC